MTEYEAARSHMIASQLRPNKVGDERLLAAFRAVRREVFVPPSLRAAAYGDEDLPLGGGRSMMKPFVLGRLLQAALPRAGDNALVVGAGTGYEAALLARLLRKVVALEEDETLARLARFALAEEQAAQVSVVEEPLRKGYRARSPYEVILSAGAVAEVPAEILAQLAEGGRLVAVERGSEGPGRAVLIVRNGSAFVRRILFDAWVAPLPGFAPEPEFVFEE